MRSRSRSRSVTPGNSDRENPSRYSRRQLIMGMAAASTSEPVVEPEPRLWLPPLPPPPQHKPCCPLPKQLTGLQVDVTPGGTMKVSDTVTLQATPRGSIKRKLELEQSVHVDQLERAAARDLWLWQLWLPNDVKELNKSMLKFIKSKLYKKAYYTISDYINDNKAWE